MYCTNPVLPTEKKSKSPFLKLIRGRSTGFTVTDGVQGKEMQLKNISYILAMYSVWCYCKNLTCSFN